MNLNSLRYGFLLLPLALLGIACVGQVSHDPGPSPDPALRDSGPECDPWNSDGGVPETYDSGPPNPPPPPVDSGPECDPWNYEGGVPETYDSGAPNPPPPVDAGASAFLRIIDTSSSPAFDVCFPRTISDPPDFTTATPSIGGDGISDGETSIYIQVPVGTAYMRFVPAGSTDCSTQLGPRTDDSIGPFSASAGAYYSVHVDQADWSYDTITVDPTP